MICREKNLPGEYGRADSRFAGIYIPMPNMITFVDALERNRACDARVLPVTGMIF